MGGLEPDVTFVLDLPLEIAQARRKAQADRMERRDVAYFAKVREGFRAEARRRPDRIRVLDATLPTEVVQAALRAALA